MHHAIRLVTKAMATDLGDVIASQVRDYADGQCFSEQNPNAMRKALEWLSLEWVDQMLKQTLNEDAYEAIMDLSAEIEQELLGVIR